LLKIHVFIYEFAVVLTYNTVWKQNTKC